VQKQLNTATVILLRNKGATSQMPFKFHAIKSNEMMDKVLNHLILENSWSHLLSNHLGHQQKLKYNNRCILKGYYECNLILIELHTIKSWVKLQTF